MIDILMTYDIPEPETYGEVYFKAALLLKSTGHQVQFLNLDDFASNYDFSDSYLQKLTKHYAPKLIISHQASLQRSLRSHLGTKLKPTIYGLLEEEIEKFILKHYQGKSQTNSHYNASCAPEFKEGFVYRMRRERIPIPLSLIRGVDIPEAEWTYQNLSQRLSQGQQSGFLVKDITESKGQGVHYLTEDNPDLMNDQKIKIAQQKIANNNPFPCSLRFVTFPGKIIASFFYYSKTDTHRSNLPDNYTKILITPENIETLTKEDPLVSSLLSQNGFTPDLEIRDDILDLGKRVSALSSQSLLRGIDLIFDKGGNPYFLEAQTNPGYSWGSTYPLIAGLETGDRSHNLSIASWVIAHQIAQFLRERT